MNAIRSRISLVMLVQLCVTFSLLLMLNACASGLLAKADTPEQRYAAVKLTYDAALATAYEIVADTAAPLELRRTVQKLVGDSADIYRSSNAAYLEFIQARDALAAGTTPAEKLTIATANLERWIGSLDAAGGKLRAATRR